MPRRRAKRMSAKMLAKLREKHLPKAKDEKELQTELVHIRYLSFHRTHRVVVKYSDWNCWIKNVTEYWNQFYKLKFRPDESWKDIVRKIEADADDLLAQPSGCFLIKKVSLSTDCKNWKTGRHSLVTNVLDIGKGMIQDPEVVQDIEVIRSDLLRTPKLFQQSEKYLHIYDFCCTCVLILGGLGAPKTIPGVILRPGWVNLSFGWLFLRFS